MSWTPPKRISIYQALLMLGGLQSRLMDAGFKMPAPRNPDLERAQRLVAIASRALDRAQYALARARTAEGMFPEALESMPRDRHDVLMDRESRKRFHARMRELKGSNG